MSDAKKSAKRAKDLIKTATAREKRVIHAISLMNDGIGPEALAVIREHLVDHHRDALMLRLASRLSILGCSGAGVANFPEELLALLTTVEDQYGDDWAVCFCTSRNRLLCESVPARRAFFRIAPRQCQRVTLGRTCVSRDRGRGCRYGFSC